ncbi:dihydrodipicolinate synthase family protein [Mangrovicella endophytica]|uniref:dihydrodipicolinate synthase family protein n=1 Tax=Mangrovicella endophytica TaxID=2066697 RepID=UPI000C9DACB2|nr:dihydrodipicolinate synthase family protein [Mangrovicella endophytica]
MIDWAGVFPAVTTKMTRDGAVDVESTQASVERLISAGVNGVVMLPMLGENASLSEGEREQVLRAAGEVVAGRVPMLSGLAAVTTEEAASTARKMRSWGAEGFMAFPSLGYRTDGRETVAWYRALASAGGLPIMIYNNPISYGVDVTPEILGQLADVPEIVCIKEESGDVRRVTDLFNALGDRFRVFCGVDDQVLESVALGATGWVSGMTNAWPRECVELFNSCRSGELDRARPLYRLLTPAFHLDTHVKLVQYIKLADHLANGAPEWCRPPRLPLEGEERSRVVEIVETAIARLAAEKAQ